MALERGGASHAPPSRPDPSLELLDAVGAAIAIIDPYTCFIIQVNTVLASWMESSPQQLVGRRCQGLVCPARERPCPFAHQGLMVEGCEDLLPLPDGTTRPVLRSVRRVELGGRPLIIETLLDNSATKRAEDTLRENARRQQQPGPDSGATTEALRTFFDGADRMVMVADTTGRLVHANRVACSKLGCNPDQISALFGPVEPKAADTLPIASSLLPLLQEERRHAPSIIAMDGHRIPMRLRTLHGFWEGTECTYLVAEDLRDAQVVNERFEQLFRHSPVPMVLSRLSDKRFVYANDTFIAMLGYTRDEIIGETPLDLGLFADPFEHVQVAQSLVCQRRIRERELVLRHKDGTIRHGLVSVEPLAFDSERFALYVVLDITGRKHTEAALEQHRKQLSLALASARMGTWHWDVSSGRCHLDEQACALLGYDPARFTGRPDDWFEQVHPEDRERVQQALQRTLGQGAPYDCEHRIIWPDSTVRSICVRGRVVQDVNGGPVQLDGILWDQTDRVQAREALEKSESRFSQLAQVFPETIFETDPQGRVTYTNEHGFRTFGATPADLEQGLSILELVAPEEREQIANRLRERMQGAEGGLFAFHALCRTGRVFPAMAYTALVMENGRVLGLRGLVLDITEQKRTERELRTANQQLERATAQAQDLASQAERASAAKTEFLAAMSHELRTPLNGVIGMADLLLDTSLSEEQRGYAELVRLSGESLLNVVNSILDFSKIEAHELTSTPIPFDLHAHLTELAASFGIRAQKKHLTFSCETERNVPRFAYGDACRLRQILTNLLDNAIKFTSNGQVTLHVTVLETCKEHVTLRFAVRDTGIGIPHDKLHLVFEKFTQLDSSTTRRYGGTGLGLALSKNLAELLGGTIGVESTVGAGSEFWFTARLAAVGHGHRESEAVEASRDAETKPAPTTAPTPTLAPATRRVLLAEDSPMAQKVLLGLLRADGLVVDGTANGKEALAALAKNHYDLVLMDVEMPEMGGLETTRRVRAGEAGAHNSHIPIVAMTGYSDPDDRDGCLSAGMNGHIAKPITRAELSALIAKWLPLSASRETPAPSHEPPANASSPPSCPSTQGPPIFNVSALLERLMGDRSLAGIVVRGFLEDIPRQLSTLQLVLDRGDIVLASRQIHSIRGAAATVGGEALAQLTADLDHLSGSLDLEALRSRREEIEWHVEQLQKAMSASGLVGDTKE